MEENKTNDTNIYNCPNCGARLILDKKVCEYCGSVNKYYNKKAPKDIQMDKNLNDSRDITNAIGGFLGGVILNDIFNGRPGRPPHRRK